MRDGRSSLPYSYLSCFQDRNENCCKRRLQVSLRGASVKEASRDELLGQVAQERLTRSLAKQAAASALFIQVLPRCSSLGCSAVVLSVCWGHTHSSKMCCVTCHAYSSKMCCVSYVCNSRGYGGGVLWQGRQPAKLGQSGTENSWYKRIQTDLQFLQKQFQIECFDLFSWSWGIRVASFFLAKKHLRMPSGLPPVFNYCCKVSTMQVAAIDFFLLLFSLNVTYGSVEEPHIWLIMVLCRSAVQLLLVGPGVPR